MIQTKGAFWWFRWWRILPNKYNPDNVPRHANLLIRKDLIQPQRIELWPRMCLLWTAYLPEMNIFGSTEGRIETDITSPSWSVNTVLLCPSSISHSIHVESPKNFQNLFVTWIKENRTDNFVQEYDFVLLSRKLIPEEVIIELSLTNLQHDRYPSCAANSL